MSSADEENWLSISVIVAAHPSFTEFPSVYENVKIPALIQVGTDDHVSFGSEEIGCLEVLI